MNIVLHVDYFSPNHHSVNFKDAGNQRVVSKLIREVQATNPSFQACHIRGDYNLHMTSITKCLLPCLCSCCQNLLQKFEAG